MDPLSVTASIIAVVTLTGKFIQYLNDVKDAPKDRGKCAIEASNLHHLLTSLRYHLEGQNADAPWFVAVRNLAFEDGALDQFKKELELLLEKVAVTGRSRRVVQAMKWKIDKEEVNSILDRMERLKTLVVIALEMDHLKLSQAIKDGTDALLIQVPAIHSGVAEIQQGQTDTKHRELLEWISSTNYPAQQSDMMKSWQPGTGQWFLNHSRFVKWRDEANTTLFCPGIPGAGKTMISAITVDQLLKSALNSSTGVAYVYCNYKEEQDTFGMLAAILKQLARPNMEPIRRLHNRRGDGLMELSLDGVIGCLLDVFTCYTKVYIVIDALDECQDGSRRQLLFKLSELRTGRDIRLMVTSRFITEIEESFRMALQLEVQADKADVQRFIIGRMDRLPECIRSDPALQELVRDKIVEATDGMFLLARFHVESLQAKRTPKAVKLTLAQLSKGLNSLRSAYAKVIERIEGQLDDDCALAKKVMSWVTYAKRPLRTAELRCALAVEPGKIELDPENLLEVEDIVSVCAGLVVHDQANDVFRLMHHTTQGYLEDISKSWEPGPQLLLTTTCLTYLSFDAFKGGSCSQHELNERLVEHKFLNYAANHWGEHARSVEDAVADLACSLLLHDGFLSCATQANHYYSGSETYRDYTALHCGAYFNLPQLARIILRTAETDVLNLVNAKTGDGHTPLLIATAMGHSTMVELLLQHGAEDDSQDKSGLHGRALERAACYGHEHIVKLLLDAKSSVNAEELYLGHALCSASTQGHEQMVELLLSRGADINAIGEYGTALTCAIRFGHKKLATWLIGKGADVNADTRWYASALHSASFFGYVDILILLLDAGADVNAPPGPRGSALWAALKARYMGIAKVLIAAGAVAIEPSHVFRGRPRDAVAVTSRPKGRRSASVEMRLPSEARVATPQAVSRLVTGAGSVQTKARLRLTLEEFVRQVEEAEAGLDEGEQ